MSAFRQMFNPRPPEMPLQTSGPDGLLEQRQVRRGCYRLADVNRVAPALILGGPLLASLWFQNEHQFLRMLPGGAACLVAGAVAGSSEGAELAFHLVLANAEV